LLGLPVQAQRNRQANEQHVHQQTQNQTDVLARYQKVVSTKPGEESYFRFYQMDITLAPA